MHETQIAPDERHPYNYWWFNHELIITSPEPRCHIRFDAEHEISYQYDLPNSVHAPSQRHIQRYLAPEATKSLVHAFIMSRLDYGNALPAGLPLEHLKKLQRIQNIVARIITFTLRRDHITPILKQLHWLPIKRRIEFKILLLVFRCINGTAPLYLPPC